jgi:hypothetical protein
MVEKRNLKRRAFSYYMQAVDEKTQKTLGYLADISPRGFRLDCKQSLPPDQDYQLRLDLTSDVADKPFMVIVARTKWCRIDVLDPFVFNIGFQVVNMGPEDAAIFQRIVEKYGTGQ